MLSGLPPRAIFLGFMVGAIALFLFLDRKKVSRHYILFYRRTERGIEYIHRIAAAAPRFWSLYGGGGVAAAAVSIPVALVTIGYTFFVVFFRRATDQGPSLIAPGVGSEAQFQAGVSFIPAEYWFAGIAVLMVVHELSHGIVASNEDFGINSVGWIVLGVIPGAFVEPKGENMLPGDELNEDESTGVWEDGNWKSRLKVLAAGSWANYLTAALFFLLAFGLVQGVTAPEETGYIGILVGEENGTVTFQAQEGFPAYEAGLRNGTLLSINGDRITSVENISEFSENLQPGETVTVETNSGFTTMEADSREVRRMKDSLEDNTAFFEWLRQGLWTIGTLNLLIGLFNMVPMKPLDGGLMVETLIKRFRSEDDVRYLDRFSGLAWLGLIAAMAFSLLGGSGI